MSDATSLHAKQVAIGLFRRWGTRNLIKVTDAGEINAGVHGYVTSIPAIAGKTPPEISAVIGLGDTGLTSGAMIYRLERIPQAHQFEVGDDDDAEIAGATRYEILRNSVIPATLLGQLRPAEPFDLRKIRRPGASATVFSGTEWWHANQSKYPNSAEISDLAPSFSTAVATFLRALESGGATVKVSATRRNRLRAHLMHYSWAVAHGQIAPGDVPIEPELAILWDHGTDAASRRAAQEMVRLFGIVYEPSLTSNHIIGKAVDMDISWSDPFVLKNARGREVVIDRPRRHAVNTSLHAVGATYGVHKLSTDAPHWSWNGH